MPQGVARACRAGRVASAASSPETATLQGIQDGSGDGVDGLSGVDGREDSLLPVEVEQRFRLRTEQPKANRFAHRYPQALRCLHDLGCFGGGVVVELLKTHPTVLFGHVVVESPPGLFPDESLEERE